MQRLSGYDTVFSANKLTHVQFLAEKLKAERAKIGTNYIQCECVTLSMVFDPCSIDSTDLFVDNRSFL